MVEWVRAGMLRDVPGQENNMENEAGHVLKAGMEGVLAA